MAEGAACIVWPTTAAPGRSPAALEATRRPFEKVQAAGCDLEGVEHTPVTAAQKHTVDVEVQ